MPLFFLEKNKNFCCGYDGKARLAGLGLSVRLSWCRMPSYNGSQWYNLMQERDRIRVGGPPLFIIMTTLGTNILRALLAAKKKLLARRQSRRPELRDGKVQHLVRALLLWSALFSKTTTHRYLFMSIIHSIFSWWEIYVSKRFKVFFGLTRIWSENGIFKKRPRFRFRQNIQDSIRCVSNISKANSKGEGYFSLGVNIGPQGALAGGLLLARSMFPFVVIFIAIEAGINLQRIRWLWRGAQNGLIDNGFDKAFVFIHPERRVKLFFFFV